MRIYELTLKDRELTNFLIEMADAFEPRPVYNFVEKRGVYEHTELYLSSTLSDAEQRAFDKLAKKYGKKITFIEQRGEKQ